MHKTPRISLTCYDCLIPLISLKYNFFIAEFISFNNTSLINMRNFVHVKFIRFSILFFPSNFHQSISPNFIISQMLIPSHTHQFVKK